jgi:hypothetical protein
MVLSCISSSVSSQDVTAKVDKNKIFIGEQIQLKLSLRGAHAGTSWFSFPDSMNHIEVVAKGKIDTVLNGATTSYSQTITLTSFDSGRWDFPSLVLPGISRATNPIPIEVLPVDVSGMQDYNDIKDIEEVKQQNNWLIVGIIGAITLISLIAIYILFLKKKKVFIAAPTLKGKQTPLEWALSQLNKLDGRNFNTQVEVKKYYSELTNISRTFFHMQLQQDSHQQTTDEWMVRLQPLTVDNDTKTYFFQFLRLSDTVKFAKYFPPERENQSSVEAIKNMVQKVSLLHSDIYSNYQPK